MTYIYRCPECGSEFEIIKSYKDIDVTEYCPICGDIGERQFVPKHLHLSKTSVRHAEYNPGLGCVVKNERHKEYLCKKLNVVEVGNDFKSADSMTQTFDRAREEKINKRWEDT